MFSIEYWTIILGALLGCVVFIYLVHVGAKNKHLNNEGE